MRELPIYPQQFGSGIPNPIGPATFRGVEQAKKGWVIHNLIIRNSFKTFFKRMGKPPENWGPLVTKRLQFGTDVALFSKDQWEEIQESLKKKDEGQHDRLVKDDLSKQSQQASLGWAFTKEHKKK